MTYFTRNANLGKGGAGMHGAGTGSAAALLGELQRSLESLKVRVASHGSSGAATGLPASGLTTTSKIVSCIWHETTGGVSDVTALTSCTGAGVFAISNVPGAGSAVLTFFNK